MNDSSTPELAKALEQLPTFNSDGNQVSAPDEPATVVVDLTEEVENAAQDTLVSSEETEPTEEEEDVDSEEEVPTDENPQEPQKRNRVSAKVRIARLTKEREEARRAAKEREIKLSELNEKYNLLQADKYLADAATAISYADAVKHRLDIEKRALREAIEAGDATKQADSQANVAALSADFARASELARTYNQHVDRVRQYKAEYSQRAQPSQQVSQEQVTTASLTENEANWLSRNPWFDENSPDHDSLGRNLAIAYANKLNRELRKSGRENDIDTPGYYKMIDDYLAVHYWDEEPKPSPRVAPKMRREGTVAPVANTNQNLGAKSEQVRLSEDQYKVVESMVESLMSKGLLKDAKGNPITNKTQAIRTYVRQTNGQL